MSKKYDMFLLYKPWLKRAKKAYQQLMDLPRTAYTDMNGETQYHDDCSVPEQTLIEVLGVLHDGIALL